MPLSVNLEKVVTPARKKTAAMPKVITMTQT